MFAKLSRIPNFILASSPSGLQRKMLETNLKFSAEHRYFDIQKDGAKWIAWFYRDLDSMNEQIKVMSEKSEA